MPSVKRKITLGWQQLQDYREVLMFYASLVLSSFELVRQEAISNRFVMESFQGGEAVRGDGGVGEEQTRFLNDVGLLVMYACDRKR